MRPASGFLKSALYLIAIAIFIALALAGAAQAQTFSVIHSFTGGADGYEPFAGVTIDQAGNLYGTTTEYIYGSVFSMKQRNGAWILNTLYHWTFPEWIPQGRPVIGPGGALYGTTSTGGNGDCGEFGCGTVYAARPPQTVCRTVSCPWSANLVSFEQVNGDTVGFVDPVFDSAGNMYVTTITGGGNYDGNVVQLTRSGGGVWTPSSIFDFNGDNGLYPYSGVIFDAQGNIYGTTWSGGANQDGTVYRLVQSGGSWNLETLHTFNATDGKAPVGGLVFDQAGNLYGTTEWGGSGGGGTVFELSPSNGGWTFTVLHSFTGPYGPFSTLAIDASGNLYGTTYADGAYNVGSVFKLTRNGGGWTFTDLHDFTGGSDGANPVGGVTLGGGADLYGTAAGGGLQNCSGQVRGCGVVWEITQ